MLKWAICLWLSFAGFSAAQSTQNGIIVTGQGRVAMPPDMAVITLGVTQTAETAKGVMDKVNASVAELLEGLARLNVEDKDRQTSGFYLRPVHQDRGTSGSRSPKIIGYQAGNSVTVRVRDLAQLGDLMDGVIDLGANNFNGLQFSLQDDSDALAQARAQAVADAKLRAAQLSQAAGVVLGPVVRMSEISHQGGPSAQGFEMARASMSDAIATGEVDVTAQVTMVFEIGAPE